MSSAGRKKDPIWVDFIELPKAMRQKPGNRAQCKTSGKEMQGYILVQIKLEFSNTEYGCLDVSNLLVLPSKKGQTKVITDKKEKTRFLSKAQGKKQEKVVKKKKENRAALLELLSHVQASPNEDNQLTTISAVQTLGLRKFTEIDIETPNKEKNLPKTKLSSIAGAKKRLRLLKLDNSEKAKKAKYDPNVVGVEESSEDSSSDSEHESDVEETESVENGHENENKVNHDCVSTVAVSDKEDIETNTQCKSEKTAEVQDKTSTPIANKNGEKVGKNENEEIKKPILECPTQHVEVKRDPKIQVARLKLPILGEEQRIMELINENEFLIVAGETGSGKTTQIPQFLYEAGYAQREMVGVTEPRRVATVAMAARVGHELGLGSNKVSYLMRFEGNVTKDTRIKFMTDGVLLKEIQTDFLLSKYSVIIIDEAHERSVYTDILLGLLSRIVPLRRKRAPGAPLRVIIMSATLRLEDFTENTRLFKEPPPVIKIDARQFPVTVLFNKHTFSDYLKEAFKKTVKIHTRLPEGGILIFVTGQQEVRFLVRKLKASFPYRKDVDYTKLITKSNKSLNDADAALNSEPDDIESDDDEVEKEIKRARKAKRKAKLKAKALPKINLDDYDMPDDDGQADLVDGDDDSEGHLSDSDAEEYALTPAIKSCRQPLWALPLYSMLGTAKQARVFEAPPPGARLCVVSTDVAETSLTIPAIKYVVDTGKKKMRVYDHVTGASAWRVVWTSQASAEQRSGRAGRVGAGHAYRLYSSAVFQHDCAPHHPPELCRRPVDDVVLTMRCMGIDKVVNFPFPTAPDRLHLRLAEKRLQILGILERDESKEKRPDGEETLKVTPLGIAVSAFPLLPRYGKMLALSHQHNLLPYMIALVSAFTVQEVMNGKPDSWPATGNTLLLGDPGVLLRAVGATEYAYANGEEEVFCAKYGLREKAMKEIRKLRKQLTSEINLSVDGLDLELTVDPGMKPPDDNQARLMRQLVLCGLGDQVGKKIGLHEVKKGEDKRKFKYAYHCGNLDEPVHLHSYSILRKTIPEWVVYQELYETGGEENRKMLMRNVTAIEPEWLPVYVPQLCNLGEPLTDSEPRYDEKCGRVKCHYKGTFGKAGWQLPTVEIDFPDKIERYRWFARFILDGSVFPRLKKYCRSLLSPPSTMVKSWARLQPRTEAILKALIVKRVGTRDALTEIWKEQADYLLKEYLQWLPKFAHYEATMFWPPL